VTARKIVAALDVFDREPLPPNHPLRTAPNTVMTPHLGYGVHETWQGFYPQSVENALAFLDGKPVRVTNPEALAKRGLSGTGKRRRIPPIASSECAARFRPTLRHDRRPLTAPRGR
jgi:hypothetical protein